MQTRAEAFYFTCSLLPPTSSELASYACHSPDGDSKSMTMSSMTCLPLPKHDLRAPHFRTRVSARQQMRVEKLLSDLKFRWSCSHLQKGQTAFKEATRTPLCNYREWKINLTGPRTIRMSVQRMTGPRNDCTWLCTKLALMSSPSSRCSYLLHVKLLFFT